MSYRVRELPAEEWGRIAGLGHWATCPLPDPRFARLLVVEDRERIVATWFALSCTHLEGVWIDPAYHASVSVVRRLIVGMMRLLQQAGVRAVYTMALEDRIARLARQLGFQPWGGALYQLPVPAGGTTPCQPFPSP